MVITNYIIRTFDIVVSLLLMVALAPLLALIAVSIKINSSGPVIFVQDRYGKNKHTFRIYKFRTMIHATQAKKFVQATENDTRITAVGRILRRTSCDELPQLLNVFRGEMSLVGPRPHPVELDDEYSTLINGYDCRFRVRPGITGLAQITGHRGPTPNTLVMQNRICKDIQYIQHLGVMLYVKILIITPIVLLTKSNARGF